MLSAECIQHHPCLDPAADKTVAAVAADCKKLDYTGALLRIASDVSCVHRLSSDLYDLSLLICITGEAAPFVGDIRSFLGKIRSAGDIFRPFRDLFNMARARLATPGSSEDSETERHRSALARFAKLHQPSLLAKSVQRARQGIQGSRSRRARVELAQEHDQLIEERKELLAERKELLREKQAVRTVAKQLAKSVKAPSSQRAAPSTKSTSATRATSSLNADSTALLTPSSAVAWRPSAAGLIALIACALAALAVHQQHA